MNLIQASCKFYNQLGGPSPVKISLLPKHWVVCTYSSTLRYGSEEYSNLLDMPFPERTMVDVEMAGHRLELNPYHGRDTADEDMEDMGFSFVGERPVFDAAVITPEKLQLVTYSPTGDWTILEYLIKGGCLEYEGKFYGDFAIDVVTKV